MATSKLNHIVPVEFTLTNYDNRTQDFDAAHYTSAFAIGNLVVINIDCKINKSLTYANSTLFVLPSEYIPKKTCATTAFMEKSGVKQTVRGEVSTGTGYINFHHGGASIGDTITALLVYII